MDIISLIYKASELNTSDIHIIANSPPMFRVRGSVQPVEGMAPLSPEEIDDALKQLTTDEQQKVFQKSLELDFGFSVPPFGRIRGNAAKQRGTTALVIRLLPAKSWTIEEIGLPDICKELILKPRGMVVVSGPTGSGKTTTLSAMINYLNETAPRRLVTIEDPIEFVYTGKKCVISQRELGEDTKSFAEALRHILRQDPNVIMVGEMRDLETAAAAIEIAETGHLILTTGHAPSAPQTIERIIDMFPPSERATVQSRLASLLVGVISQVLVPTADGKGRVAAREIMLASPAIKSNIRDGKVYQIPNVMLTQAKMGMVLLDTSLVNLYRKGMITRENVLAFCNEPDEVNKLIGGGGMIQ